MAKLTIDQIVKSDTPYFDVFGEETRKPGRPSGAVLDYGTTLELPARSAVPDRIEAQQIRSKVKARALAVLHAIHAEELREIYRAELALEIGRLGGESDPNRDPVAPRRKVLISEEDAKAMPGSGFKPGETYWEWMQTFTDKDDETWQAEKATVKSNIERIKKGGRHGD